MRTSGTVIWAIAWAAAGFVGPAAALACLWDRDTLRTEARGLPGIVEVITGRFEREPALYFEMRLARVSAQIGERPDDLALYDDAGVACDRLGRSDEAIDWMRRKGDALGQADPEAPATRDHRYRYLANLGTFHAHRWLRAGADRERLNDLEQARGLIAGAIALNPDAHFGRERYQLLAIEWLLDPHTVQRVGGVPPTVFDALEFPTDWVSGGRVLRALGYSDAVEGLAGLIALGDAWESLDVFCALAFALDDEQHASLAYLARLRCLELIESGGRSLHPNSPMPDRIAESLAAIGRHADDQDEIAGFFAAARAEAERWRAARSDYMLARLRAGEHPDTHPDFWSGYTALDPPDLPNGLVGLVGEQRDRVVAAAFAAGVLVCGIAGLYVLRRVRRRVRVAA